MTGREGAGGMRELLFSYEHGVASDACVGEDPGGWAFSVYTDGTVERKAFLFGEEDTPVYREESLTDPETVERIRRVLRRRKRIIDRMPEYLDNRSYDGYYDEFGFYGKKVWVLNLVPLLPYERILYPFLLPFVRFRKEWPYCICANCLVSLRKKVMREPGIQVADWWERLVLKHPRRVFWTRRRKQ